MIRVFDTEEDAKNWLADNGYDERNFRIRYVDDDCWSIKGFIIIEDR